MCAGLLDAKGPWNTVIVSFWRSFYLHFFSMLRSLRIWVHQVESGGNPAIRNATHSGNLSAYVNTILCNQGTIRNRLQYGYSIQNVWENNKLPSKGARLDDIGFFSVFLTYGPEFCKKCFYWTQTFDVYLITITFMPTKLNIYVCRVFHNCWNKAIGHKSRILNDTTMMITFIERWKDNIL